jgi:hypothetical protein
VTAPPADSATDTASKAGVAEQPVVINVNPMTRKQSSSAIPEDMRKTFVSETETAAAQHTHSEKKAASFMDKDTESEDDTDGGEHASTVPFRNDDGSKGDNFKRQFEDLQAEDVQIKRQLEDLQIKTIFSLVEHLDIEVGGLASEKKLLFLTNNQARKFDFTNIERVLQAMDISPMPVSTSVVNHVIVSGSLTDSSVLRPQQLVINLFTSFNYCFQSSPAKWGLMGHFRSPNSGSGTITHKLHAELDDGAVDDTDIRLVRFLQECVLPVAVQTNALVLVHSDGCSLSHAFSQLCASETQKNGGSLPFTVMCISSVFSVHAQSNTPGSTAYALKQSSRRWRDSHHAVHQCATAGHGDEWSAFTADDIPFGATHNIIVDGITNGKMDYSARNLFKNALVQRISEDLPSIAIQTMCGGSAVIQQLHDYTSRGMPLLLLDSRLSWQRQHAAAAGSLPDNADTRHRSGSRKSLLRQQSALTASQEPCDLATARKAVVQLQDDLEESGVTNGYLMSSLAYLHTTFGKQLKQEKADEVVQSTRTHIVPLWSIIDKLQAQDEHALEDDKYCNYEMALEVAQIAQEQHNKELKSVHLHERIRLEQVLAAVDAIPSEEATAAQLSTVVRKASRMWAAYLSSDGKNEELCGKCPEGHELHGFFKVVPRFRNGHLWQRLISVEDTGDSAKVQAALVVFRTFISDWKEAVSARELASSATLSREEYFGIIGLMQSPCVYSANLSSTVEISQCIASVAKIDRLPSANTLQAQIILRSCWDNVDIFSNIAERCKSITKALYVILLALGIATTTISICWANGLINEEHLNYLVLVLSVAGSVITTVVSFANPGQRWQQLRGAALAVESEVWMFRTRSGAYTVNNKVGVGRFSRKPERQLMDVLEAVTQHVSKSASIMETTFFSQYDMFGKAKSPGFYTHGQYQGSRSCGTFRSSCVADDHKKPLKVRACACS